MRKNFKQQHGTANVIIKEQEKSILATIDRANASSTNAQVIGNNGEIPLRTFLCEHLPYTFRAVSGHFVTPSGALSPQIDILILDSRYPFLNVNLDGTVLAMMHSVISTVEVKTSLVSSDIKKICKDSLKINALFNESFDTLGAWGRPFTQAFAYRSKIRIYTAESAFHESHDPFSMDLDLSIMRLHESDQPNGEELGVELHYEPEFTNESTDPIGYDLVSIYNRTPLSDFYYALVQNSYYTLGSRGITEYEIGRHVMDYMAWSTYLADHKENK